MNYKSEISGDDPEYNALFKDDESFFLNLKNVRSFIEALWENFKKIADSKFKSQIRSNFHSCYFEMYMANCIIQNTGYSLNSADTGPDIYIIELDSWIECVTANNGNPSDPDSVPEPVYLNPADPDTQKADDVPNEQIILRYTNAFSVKAKQISKHMQKGIIKPNQSIIIAINAAKVFHSKIEPGYPRILSALFPIGNEYITVDKKSTNLIGMGIEYSSLIIKKNKSEIKKLAFTSNEFDYITGVIFSIHDVWNYECLNQVGDDLIFIPNPYAKNPISSDFLKIGRYCEINIDEKEYRITTKSV